MTKDEILERLYYQKTHTFLMSGEPKQWFWADLVADTEMREWNGIHPVEENETVRIAKAGTTVLITVASRFGDVGIRDKLLKPGSDGYYARVFPDELENWRPIPEDVEDDWEPKPYTPPPPPVFEDLGNGIIGLRAPEPED